jgi:hypothetical protein
VELAIKLHDQLKQLLQTSPVTIPDPTVIINKVNLMAMEHDAHLDVLDQLVPNSIWGTPKHMALLNEMGIDSVLVSKRNSIHIPFKLHHFRGTSEETALLDTGATESFIDIGTVKRLKLGAQELEMSRPVYKSMVLQTIRELSHKSAIYSFHKETKSKEPHSTS